MMDDPILYMWFSWVFLITIRTSPMAFTCYLPFNHHRVSWSSPSSSDGCGAATVDSGKSLRNQEPRPQNHSRRTIPRCMFLCIRLHDDAEKASSNHKVHNTALHPGHRRESKKAPSWSGEENGSSAWKGADGYLICKQNNSRSWGAPSGSLLFSLQCWSVTLLWTAFWGNNFCRDTKALFCVVLPCHVMSKTLCTVLKTHSLLHTQDLNRLILY